MNAGSVCRAAATPSKMSTLSGGSSRSERKFFATRCARSGVTGRTMMTDHSGKSCGRGGGGGAGGAGGGGQVRRPGRREASGGLWGGGGGGAWWSDEQGGRPRLVGM